MRRRSPFPIVLLAVLLPLAPSAQEGAPDETPLVTRVAAALRPGGDGAALHGVRLAGRARRAGLDGEFSLLFLPSGPFVLDVRDADGRLPSTTGFDGRRVWERERGGLSRELALEDRDRALLETWLRSGTWLTKGSGPAVVAREPDGAQAGELLLELGLEGTPLAATLAVDPQTFLPRTLRYLDESGPLVTTFSDYREVLGLMIAQRVTVERDGRVHEQFDVAEAGQAPVFVRNPYERIDSPATDCSFDGDAAAELETKRLRSGHLLVHPLVDGEDVGWFIFDSGAGALVIDGAHADALELDSFGEVVAVGAAGKVTAHYRSAASFVLGPLTLKDPLFVALDLGFLSRIFGVEVAGICGYDVFARAVVELELATDSVALFDPAAYELEGGAWRELLLDERIPCVEARFEGDRSGLFKIDSGASGTLIFHAPAVERFGLLRGRDVAGSGMGGVGGFGRAATGKLEWLELGGQRFEALTVQFAQTELGALTDRYTVGNLGQEVLDDYRLVFDYPNGRIALPPASAR